MKDYVIYAALAVVLVLGVVFPIGGKSVVERVTQVGAQVGPENFETQFFRTNFTVGGKGSHVATTSTDTLSAYTLTTSIVDTDIPFVSFNNGINITLTTMASTSAPFNQMAVGESFEQIWYAATSTAGATITFAAGTGVDLQEDEGGTVILNGLETARVTYLKKVDTDIAVIVEPYQVGD